MQFLKAAEYQPLARKVYDDLVVRLRSALPEAVLEHVGSSSIDGLLSKGDLDILVGVAAGDFEHAVEVLAGIGLKVKEGSLRNEALCPFELFGQPLDVGVQLVALGSEWHQLFIVFRDRLRQDAALRERYNQLKLKSTGLSAQDYRKKKSEFIEALLATAPDQQSP